jgi:hypothetical protein
MNTLLRRVINAWILWRIDRRLLRAHPQIRERAQAIKAARRSHRKTKPLIDEQQEEMIRLLKAGL